MAEATPPAPVRRRTLLSHNVNGLAGRGKRLALLGRIAPMPGAIVALQETHCPDDDTAAAWLRQGTGAGRPWGGRGFWSHGTRASRGVAILFTPGFDGEDITVEFTDTAEGSADGDTGRLLRVGWREPQTEQRWSVVVVYAPINDRDRALFFADGGPASRALAAGPRGAHVVVAGDFNCILDEADSSAPTAAAQAAMACANGLRALAASAGLVDAWLAARARAATAAGAEDRHTYWATNGTTARRLDRAYVSVQAAAAGTLLDCRHWCLGDLPGDHRAVALDLAVGGGAPPRGPARWRLPVDLLRDDDFCAAIRRELGCAGAAAGRCWEHMAGTGAMARWLAFKALARDLARVHAARHARERAGERAALVRKVEAAQRADEATAAEAAATRAAARRAGAGPGSGAGGAGGGSGSDGGSGGGSGSGSGGVGGSGSGSGGGTGSGDGGGGSGSGSGGGGDGGGVRAAAARLRAFDAEAAARDADKADAAWSMYGEGPTFWFHRLGRVAEPSPPMAEVRDPRTGARASAAAPGGATAGAAIAARYFDGDAPAGLFAPPATDAAAQREVLAALDKTLPAGARHAAEGPERDGRMTAAELRAALQTLPRGKAPGLDGLPYEFYGTFWPDLQPLLHAAVNEIQHTAYSIQQPLLPRHST